MPDFSNYAGQGLQFGKTVAYPVTELVNADGSHPILDVEHVGQANTSFIEELIATAKADDKEESPLRLADAVRANRDRLSKHAVRHLRNTFFSDGAEATDAAIPAFIDALPAIALERLLAFVSDPRNFCAYPIAEKPAAVAEK